MHVLKHHNETHYFVHLIHIINVNKNKLVLHLFVSLHLSGLYVNS